MMFKENFFESYIEKAPVALALERNFECEILSKKRFDRPILDIGCGDGIFASVLFSEKIDVGLDPNADELKRAEHEDAYFELLNCYGDRVPKPDGSFKTIFSNSVFEHIEKIGPVLDECHRLLASDGRLYLTLPTNRFEQYSIGSRALNGIGLSGLAQRFQKFYNKFWVHHHAYHENDWTKLFNEHGFAVADMQLYDSKNACSINDGLAYLAVTSLFARKILNRWFFFPKLRRLTAPLWTAVWKPLLKSPRTEQEFGLVFFELRKKGTFSA